ncbi:MAG: Ig-like domain-containing protein [Candidatus Eremiobacteraeota bacterium]|nr:Ig-like domain-containing protein [Candidatus Eremiobacteraeota bacterium]MBV9647624.1 Ig-like domain-containing protein [Candidatus Eremiobacteraeota bacterium]
MSQRRLSTIVRCGALCTACILAFFGALQLTGRVARAEPPSHWTRLRGVVSAIDLNSEPPTVTVTSAGSARVISVNSDARVYVEDVTIDSRLRGKLDDIRVGDALLVVLASDGRVVELHDIFRSSAGTVAGVSANALVLGGGTVVTPSSATHVTLDDAAAKLSDVHVGDRVTVRRNPETGELREIIATRPVSAAPVPPQSVRITSFFISAKRPLRAGESFDVEMHGTADGQATFDIGNFVTANTMREETPGLYRGHFTIPDRFNIGGTPVYGHLVVSGSSAPRAEAPAELSAATTPPAIVDVAPAGGEPVNTTRPNIYATFSSPADIGIDVASIKIVVNGRDVTQAATRSGSFVTYSPSSDYADGAVTVSVHVADAAGNAATRSWSFTIKTH